MKSFFLDRLNVWLMQHGFLARPASGSCFFCDYTWNLAFWRGPYYRFAKSTGYQHDWSLRKTAHITKVLFTPGASVTEMYYYTEADR